MIIDYFKFAIVTLLHHHSQKPDYDFGVQPNKNLSFASLFSIVDTLESIIQDIDANQYDSMERAMILFCFVWENFFVDSLWLSI